MFEASAMLYLYVETPLHAGSGSSVGVVDLPIQRERVTGYPVVQASGLKGKLRSEAYEWPTYKQRKAALSAEISADLQRNEKWRDKSEFAASLVKLALPLVWFALLAVFLYTRRRARQTPRQYQSAVPYPHRGLIVMLSKYSRSGDRTAPAAEISQAIDSKQLDLDQVFTGCNWGQLAFVARYHAPTLEKCWIIATLDSVPDKKDGSADEYEHAAKLVQFITQD